MPICHIEGTRRDRGGTRRLVRANRGGGVTDLIKRLDVREPSLVIDVPGGDRIGRIVDPGFAVHGVGLGQYIGDELLGLRIETQIMAAIELAGPYLAVLVSPGGVEGGMRGGQRLFVD